MTDAQLTILLSGLTVAAGIVGGAIKWAVGRVTKALDENTAAFTAHAATAATQAEVLRTVAAGVSSVAEWCDAHTGVTNVPAGIRPKRVLTPARGAPLVSGPYGPLKPPRDEG